MGMRAKRARGNKTSARDPECEKQREGNITLSHFIC